MKTNITFYVILLLLVLTLSNLVKNSFNLGLFKITNETKMELFMGISAFAIVFSTFKYVDTQLIFDYDINKCHLDLNNRLNQALAPFNV